MAASAFHGESPSYLGHTIDLLPAAPTRLALLRRPWVQRIVPFATSFLVHAALIVTGLLLVEPIRQVYHVMTEQVIIPSVELGAATPQPLAIPGDGSDPFVQPRQDQVVDAPPDGAGWGNVRTRTMNDALMGGGGDGDLSAALALGPGRAGRGGSGIGPGPGDGGAGLAPFGPPTRGGPEIFRGGNAFRQVFVCDASGSMGAKFDVLKEQIRRSVDQLRPVQGFNIIFFNNNRAYALQESGLVMANPEGKRRAYAFLETVVPGPDSNPLPALQLAFRMRPELVHFLTDGEFEFATDANQRVRSLLAELNADGRAKINTIAFVSESEKAELSARNAGFVTLLKQIASDHGGAFRLAAAEDF